MGRKEENIYGNPPLFAKIIVVIFIAMRREVELRRHNAKKSWKIGRPDLPWSKDPLKRVKKGRDGGRAGLLFFATLLSPTEREYTRRRLVSEQTVLEIRRGRSFFYRQESKRVSECKKERRNVCVVKTRDTLVSCTTSGLPLRNEPTSLLWPVSERKFPRDR